MHSASCLGVAPKLAAQVDAEVDHALSIGHGDTQEPRPLRQQVRWKEPIRGHRADIDAEPAQGIEDRLGLGRHADADLEWWLLFHV